MKSLKTRDLPADPRGSWRRAQGPDGAAWVDRIEEPFQFKDELPLHSGWLVWSKKGGYTSVDAISFDKDYELQRPIGSDVNPGEGDSFGLG